MRSGMHYWAILIGLTWVLAVPAMAKFPEANDAVRAQAVEAAPKEQPDAVIVYAKGLCCPSCAIGVRRMVSRLPFVDTKAENLGVALDAKHQLVTVQVVKGAQVDAQQVSQAIDNAGYAPVALYRLQKGKVVKELLVVKNALWVD